MPALPTSASFTGGSVTEGQFKASLTALRDYLSGLLGADGAVATALATLGAPFSSHAEKTAAYTVNLGDRGRLITASGAGGWTLSLPAAATAGAGFSVSLWNGSTGTITIDPNGAELINGVATLEAITGSGGILVCTGTAWHWLPTGRPVTTSATDATAGRLLKTADFGLGGMAPGVADCNAITDGGFYAADGSTANRPTGSGNWLILHMRRASTDHVQHAISRNGTVAGAMVRFCASGTWSAWRRVYSADNILGAVSQSAGVPTGAVIERGNNANGDYIRFADGTQICWITAGLSQSVAAGSYAEVTWTYPAAFLSGTVPQPLPTARSLNTAAGRENAARHLRPASGGNGSSSGVLGVFNAHSAALDARIDGVVIGRWY